MSGLELNFEQGSDEWIAARAGRITASCFRYIMGSSKAQRSYLRLIRGLRGGPPDMPSLRHGRRSEPIAIADFEFETGFEVRRIGLVIHPEMPEVACSPDGLLDPDGGLEIKNPSNPEIHIRTVTAKQMPREHIPQVQGGMYVTRRRFWYFMSFDHRAPLHLRRFIQRVERDEAYIRELDRRVRAFREHLLAGTEPADHDFSIAAIPFL